MHRPPGREMLPCPPPKGASATLPHDHSCQQPHPAAHPAPKACSASSVPTCTPDNGSAPVTRAPRASTAAGWPAPQTQEPLQIHKCPLSRPRLHGYCMGTHTSNTSDITTMKATTSWTDCQKNPLSHDIPHGRKKYRVVPAGFATKDPSSPQHHCGHPQPWSSRSPAIFTNTAPS